MDESPDVVESGEVAPAPVSRVVQLRSGPAPVKPSPVIIVNRRSIRAVRAPKRLLQELNEEQCSSDDELSLRQVGARERLRRRQQLARDSRAGNN